MEAAGRDESYSLLLDGFPAGSQTLAQNVASDFGYEAALKMGTDGQLLVTIFRAGAESSDFFFERSTLDATWRDDGQQLQVATPEPASMILLGTGLAVSRRGRAVASSGRRLPTPRWASRPLKAGRSSPPVRGAEPQRAAIIPFSLRP